MKLLLTLVFFVVVAISIEGHIFNNEENLSFRGCGVANNSGTENETFSWDAVVCDQNCPAVFISKRTLLAHASCVLENVDRCSTFKVRRENVMETITLKNHMFVFNPEFKGAKAENDFVLVNLKKEQAVTPICLWSIPEMLSCNSLTEYNSWNGEMIKSKLVRENECWRDAKSSDESKHNLESGDILCAKSQGNLLNSQHPFLIKRHENKWFLRGIRRKGVEFNSSALSAYNDIDAAIEWISSSSKYIHRLPEETSPMEKYDFKNAENLSSPSCGLLDGSVANFEAENNEIEKLMAGGKPAKTGNHPWFALLDIQTPGFEPKNCGGTLIKENVVLTAAHCLAFIATNNKTVIAEPDHVTAYFGMHSLDDFNEVKSDHLSLKPKSIVVHKDFDNKYRNDIALLIFEEGVDITKNDPRISTLCLWNGDGSLNSLKHKSGTVFGFGFSAEKEEASSVLQSLVLPIVQHKECFQKGEHTLFNDYLVPGKTFCAGYRNEKKSTCRGDSGGGLAIEVNGRWFLRGIVSLGVKSLKLPCNSDYYTIFVDVHHYLQWIEDNSSNLKAAPLVILSSSVEQMNLTPCLFAAAAVAVAVTLSILAVFIYLSKRHKSEKQMRRPFYIGVDQC